MSLVQFLIQIAGALSDAEVPFMLTGSLAAAYYGTPRATQDIDVVIDPDFPQLEQLVGLLNGSGLYVSMEAAREAFEHGGQFNAIDPLSGWKADLIIRKAREFSETEFDRRQSTYLFGVELSLTTVEDLIIAKLEWSEKGDSELQWRDIRQLLELNRESLDLQYLCLRCGTTFMASSSGNDFIVEEGDPDIDELLRSGQKIQAIKLLRDKTGAGLIEAKDQVDARERELR